MSQSQVYIGIDPGASGALAGLDPMGRVVEVHDYAGEQDAARKIRELQDRFTLQAALEQVHAMPKQGVSSSFKFGMAFGAWVGVLAALGVPYRLVPPTVWQKGRVRKTDGPDPKTRSLTAARRMFPEASLARKKDDGRADALLIADWLRTQFAGEARQ